MAILCAGRYKACVTSAGLCEKGSENLLCLKMMLAGIEWKNDAGEYEPIPDGNSIIGDFYLEKKKESGGGVAEDMVKRLAHAFEWNGDLTTLADTALNSVCKITVKDEPYNGKIFQKVSWINHIDDGDGGGGYSVEHDDACAKKAQARLGSSIRALLSATTNTTKPATTQPAPRSLATPSSPPPRAHLVTMDSVWSAFEAMCIDELGKGGKMPEAEVIHNNWFALLKQVYGTEDSDAVKDWTPAMTALPEYRGQIIPF